MNIIFIAIIALMIAVTLWWVLAPLFSAKTQSEASERADLLALGELELKRDSIYAAIKDMELDYESGKIGEQDYQQGRLKFLQRAAGIIKQIEVLSSDFENRLDAQLEALLANDTATIVNADDRAAAHADIQAQLNAMASRTSNYTCPDCGHAFEPGDTFCMQCGAALIKECPTCHNAVLPDDKFCPHCGEQLAKTEGVS